MFEFAKIRIRRGDDELGSWDRFEIRGFLASGSLLLSDQAYSEEKDQWSPLIPPYRRKWNLFDWSEEEDQPWYFIKDGYIHGPRLISEISALHDVGYLSGDTLITTINEVDWISIAELVAQNPTDSLEVSAKDHANEALDQFLRGDRIGAGVSGFKAISSLWKNFAKVEPIISEWLCIPDFGEGMPNEVEIHSVITRSGSEPLEMEWVSNKKGRRLLAIRFASIEQASSVRDLLEGEYVGDEWCFEFMNRTEEMKSGEQAVTPNA